MINHRSSLLSNSITLQLWKCVYIYRMIQWLQHSVCITHMENVFPNKMQRLVRGENLYYLIFLCAPCPYSLFFFLLFCYTIFPFLSPYSFHPFLPKLLILQVTQCFPDILQTIQLFLKFILITSVDPRETPLLLMSREAHLNLIPFV